MAGIANSMAVLSRALDLRSQRHQVLASNIANADTPNYKARDFDFRAAMQNALGAAGAGVLSMARTAGGHLEGSAGAGGVSLRYRAETQSAVDGNTVDMDVERSQIAENAMQYEILTRLVNDRLQGLRTALSSTNS